MRFTRSSRRGKADRRPSQSRRRSDEDSRGANAVADGCDARRAGARQHYIDWLRVLAVLLLFPFHASRVFNTDDPFYMKAAHLSGPVSDVLNFISVWHMPLLFVLAGASTFFALGKRSTGQYLRERRARLLVPFLFGIFVLIPPQTWYGGRFNSGYTPSFWHYLVSGDFLKWNIKDGGDYYGGFGIGHCGSSSCCSCWRSSPCRCSRGGGRSEAARCCAASRAASPTRPAGRWPRCCS